MKREFYAEYFEIEDRHWWFVGRRRIFLRLLDRDLQPDPSSDRRLLDVGCGTGTMVRHLGRYGRAEGVDADTEAVRLCRQRGVDRVQHVDGVPLPFGDGAFHAVTALDVIEHVDDDAQLVRELKRVLRPGGTLLASVPAYPWLWGRQDEIAHHKRRYTATELRRLVIGAGFEVCRLSYFNTLLFPPIAAVRLARRVSKRASEPGSDFELTRPGRLNDLLAGVFSVEAPLVARVNLPFGVSVLTVARAV